MSKLSKTGKPVEIYSEGLEMLHHFSGLTTL